MRFMLVLLIPLAALDLLFTRPDRLVWWVGGGYLLVIFLDAVWPGAAHSPRPAGPGSHYFRGIVRVYAPLQWLMQICAGVIAWQSDGGVAWGLALSCGVIAGVMGVPVAHELGHSPHKGDRILAWMLMTSVCYGQFMVEHYRGHHPRAATLDDAATAQAGQGLWRFLWHKLPDSFVEAWRLEARRLHQTHRGWANSPLAWSWAVSASILLGLITSMALTVLLFWFVQSVVAIWFLETLNYIEHYGLERRYRAAWMEPFAPGHAWNADHLWSNTFFLNMQRHSDHHMQPWKPYSELECLSQTPRLPTGYAGCLILAALPFWWCPAMDRRLAQFLARDTTGVATTLPDLLRDAR